MATARFTLVLSTTLRLSKLSLKRLVQQTAHCTGEIGLFTQFYDHLGQPLDVVDHLGRHFDELGLHPCHDMSLRTFVVIVFVQPITLLLPLAAAICCCFSGPSHNFGKEVLVQYFLTLSDKHLPKQLGAYLLKLSFLTRHSSRQHIRLLPLSR